MTLWPIFLWRKKAKTYLNKHYYQLHSHLQVLQYTTWCTLPKKYENKRKLMFITVCKQVNAMLSWCHPFRKSILWITYKNQEKRGFYLLCFFILSQEMFWLGTILQTNEKYRKLLEWISLSQLHFLQIKEHLLIQPYKVLLDMKITFGEPLQKSS